MGNKRNQWTGKDGFFEQHEDCCHICALMAKNDREDRPLYKSELMDAFAKAKREGQGVSMDI